MKIAWAIDPFEEPVALQENVLKFLKWFHERSATEVHPLYVLSPDQLGLSSEPPTISVSEYITSAKRALEHRINHLKEKSGITFGSCEVLAHERSFIRGSVELLNQYLVKNHFDLVVVSSHGRRGIDRLLMGSFAESLLLASKIPVLVLSAECQFQNLEKPKILFPSDLAEDSKPVFESVLNLAKILNASVNLIHCVPKPSQLVIQSGVFLLSGVPVPTTVYSDKENERLQVTVKEWQKLAEGKKIPFRWELDQESRSVTESVFKYASQEKPTLVMMEAQLGPVASVLVGSITRQVVRNSHVPVWVIRA